MKIALFEQHGKSRRKWRKTKIKKKLRVKLIIEICNAF